MTSGLSIIPDVRGRQIPLQYDSSVTFAFPLGRQFEWFVDATASTAFAPITRSGLDTGKRPTVWNAQAAFDTYGGDIGLAFKPVPAAYVGLALGLANAPASVRYTTTATLLPSQSSIYALLVRVSGVAGYKFQFTERVALITEFRVRYGRAIATDSTHCRTQLLQLSPLTGLSIGF